MSSIPIVVIAYNRPHALKRVLHSLSTASYPEGVNVELIVSIDYSDNTDCSEVANSFKWEFGKYRIIQHDQNLGLKKHVLSCGDMSEGKDGIIVLEDDCFVSQDFYSYVVQTYEFYKAEKRICGISLYSYSINEFVEMPFIPLKGNSDVYFMQVPSSLGQFWSRESWLNFKLYLSETSETISSTTHMPQRVTNWSRQSWKKYYYDYMVTKDLLFVYPYVSRSTNFGDLGSHIKFPTQLYNVQLSCGDNVLKLTTLESNSIIYDAFYEIMPEGISALSKGLKVNFVVDTYCLKDDMLMDKEFVLTTYKTNQYREKYDTTLQPLICNYIHGLEGDGLYLVPTSVYLTFKERYCDRTIIKKHNFLSYQEGFYNGKHFVYDSKTYHVGNVIRKLIASVNPFTRKN